MSLPKTDADIARMGVRDTRAALDRDVAAIRAAAARLTTVDCAPLILADDLANLAAQITRAALIAARLEGQRLTLDAFGETP